MHAKDLIAGTFVFLSFFLFLGFVLWGGKLGGFFEKQIQIHILLKRGLPLDPGTAVRIEGLKVGEVQSITWRSEKERNEGYPKFRVRMTIAVDPKAPIAKESKIEVRSDGLLGARYVDIHAAPQGATSLHKGDTLLGSLGGIDTFLERGEEMARRLESMLGHLDQLLTPQTGKASLPELLQDLRTMTQAGTKAAKETGEFVKEGKSLLNTWDPKLREVLNSSKLMLDQSLALLQQWEDLSKDLRPKILGTLQTGGQVLQDLGTTIKKARSKVEALLARVDDILVRNDRDLFLLLHNLRVAAEEMKLAMARIKADPSQVLFGGSEDPDAAEAAAKKSLQRDLDQGGLLPPRRKE
jgi:ABC-type transporter Mla subunit MlaD